MNSAPLNRYSVISSGMDIDRSLDMDTQIKAWTWTTIKLSMQSSSHYVQLTDRNDKRSFGNGQFLSWKTSFQINLVHSELKFDISNNMSIIKWRTSTQKKFNNNETIGYMHSKPYMSATLHSH